MADSYVPRRGPRRVTGRRIPRPLDKWLQSLFAPLDWVQTGDADAPEWVRRIRVLAAEIGCQVIYDPGRHWKESLFCPAAEDGKPYILSGGAGKENYCCTVLLHEFGHAVLHARRNHPAGITVQIWYIPVPDDPRPETGPSRDDRYSGSPIPLIPNLSCGGHICQPKSTFLRVLPGKAKAHTPLSWHSDAYTMCSRSARFIRHRLDLPGISRYGGNVPCWPTYPVCNG